jgi:prevent-host-death family protein
MKATGRNESRRRVVGVRDAKAQLSRLLQAVQDGEEWTITERGKPVARLVPIARETMSLGQRVRRLEENGTIEPAHRDPLPLPPPLPLQSGLAQKMLERDRDSSA